MAVKKVSKKTKKTAVKKPVKKTTKKVVKKTTPKKAIAKKVVKKTILKKLVKKATKKKPATKQKPKIVTASNAASFWVNNGPVLNSLPALKKAITIISVEQFEFHAKGRQNDFAVWVEKVLCDKDCAKGLKKAKTQKAASKTITDALKKYKK